MNSCKAFWRPLDASIWRPSDRYGAHGWRALAQLYEMLNIEYAMICPTVYPYVSSEFFLFLLRFDTCPSKKIVASLGVMHAAARDQSWRNLLSGSLLSGIWTRVQRCAWFCCPDEESNSAFDLFGSLGFRIFEDFHAKMNFSGDFSTCEFIVSRMLWCT